MLRRKHYVYVGKLFYICVQLINVHTVHSSRLIHNFCKRVAVPDYLKIGVGVLPGVLPKTG